MDELEKLRKEIERLKEWNNNVRNSTRHMTLQEEDFNRGKHSSYLEILSLIDSIQKEPKEYNGILGENIRKIDNEIQRLERLKENPICAYSTSRYTDEERKVLCEDCQEECEYAKKKVPVSEDLEKASYYFACKCHPLKTEYGTSSPNPEVIEAFKAGAAWQLNKIRREYEKNRG